MSSLARQLQTTFKARNIILYDGDCIYCQKYVTFLRLRETLGKVAMENLRDHPHVVALLRENAIEPNEGMVFITGDNLYAGSDATHALASLSTPSGLYNRVQRVVLGNRTLSTLLYPALRFGRRMTLIVRGKGLIP